MNGMLGRNYGAEQCDVSMKMAHEPSLQQRLDLAVKQAEERLAAVTQAREIFQRNPDLELLLNLMQRGLF